jgi:hypothetical protein
LAINPNVLLGQILSGSVFICFARTMAASTSANDVIEQLKNSLSMYDDEPTLLDTTQQRAFSKFITGINVLNTSKSISKTTLYVRSRARELSSDIYNQVSPEVFILCSLTYPVHTFGALPREGLPKINKWWISIHHPAALTNLTTDLCDKNLLDSLLKKEDTWLPEAAKKIHEYVSEGKHRLHTILQLHDDNPSRQRQRINRTT